MKPGMKVTLHQTGSAIPEADPKKTETVEADRIQENAVITLDEKGLEEDLKAEIGGEDLVIPSTERKRMTVEIQPQ